MRQFSRMNFTVLAMWLPRERYLPARNLVQPEVGSTSTCQVSGGGLNSDEMRIGYMATLRGSVLMVGRRMAIGVVPMVASGVMLYYLVVDFRNTMPPRPLQPQVRQLYHVVFSVSYETACIVDSELMVVMDSVRLLEGGGLR